MKSVSMPLITQETSNMKLFDRQPILLGHVTNYLQRKMQIGSERQCILACIINCVLYIYIKHICDLIKQNESKLWNIDFEMGLKLVFNNEYLFINNVRFYTCSP